MKIYTNKTSTNAFFNLIVLILLFLAPNTANAADIFKEYWITNGFYSHHFTNRKFNEDNVGIGAQLKLEDGFTKYDSISIGTYKNSINKRTNYLTYNYMPLAWKYIQAGVGIGTLNGYHFNNGGYIPVIVPILQLSYKRIGFNFTILPKINSESPAVIAVQFKFKL